MRWRRSNRDDERPDRDGDASASSHVRPLTEDAATDAGTADDDPATGGRTVPPAPEEAAARTAADVPVDLGRIDDTDLERSIRRAVARALAEDLGDRGDVTSLATVPPATAGTAELVARAPGVVAGTATIAAVFDQLDPRVHVELTVSDGDPVERGQVLGTVSGPLRSILTGERTALNFLCHLSGVATRTRAFVDAVAGTGCAIRDTRKTTPGLRLLEKAAVAAGGGHLHRIGLHDAILVKDNHVAAAGSITAAAEAALRRDGIHVQVEVADLDQLEDALRAGVTDILLDNFPVERVRQAMRRVGGRASVEASGTIGLDTVRQYAEAGVSRVAIGAITHSAPDLDIALDVRVDAPASDVAAPVGSVPVEIPTAEPEDASGPDTDAAAAATDAPGIEGHAPDADDDRRDDGEGDGLFAWRKRQLDASDGRD